MGEVLRSPVGCTTEDRNPTAFVKWCGKNKVLWDKCAMGLSQTTGRCVIAKQLIKKDEVVVEVPDDSVLMGENCRIQEQLAEEGLLKPAEDALLEVQGLIIAVMYERALGKQSRWEPYLSFLPKDMSHMPIYWTESELAELRGTAAYDKMVGRVQHPADAPTRMPQLFEELVLPFVQTHDSVRAVLLGKGHSSKSAQAARDKLWQQYQWAAAAVASYSFILGDDHYQGMVPVWDLLNHITGKVNVRLHHNAERGVLQMIATEDIPEGAEVVNCYGHLSNAELLRGYGYVEQYNTVQHVHVPAQFLIRAAAGAAAALDGNQQQRGKSEEAEVVKRQKETRLEDREGDDDHDDDASPDASFEQSDDDMPAVSSDGDNALEGDESSSEGDDSNDGDDHDLSDDDEEDEPDWDLEDDSEDLQLQQQQPAPTLDKSLQLISDWEDRWQLCFSMKLLPKNTVYQVPAGGIRALPQQLLPVLLLLLADASTCEELATVAAAATSKAAVAAAVASKHGNSGKKPKKGNTRQKTPAAEAGAAAAADSSTVVLQAVQEELAALGNFQFCGAGALHATLLLLVQLMQSRYSCSLSDDEQQLQHLDALPPRLAAAVIARSSEKRVLQQLAQDLHQPLAQQQLMKQARQCLQDTVVQLATAAAAAAVAPVQADGCCHMPGCSHTHHRQQQQQQQYGKHKKQEKQHKHHHQEQQQQDQAGVSAKGRKRKQQDEQQGGSSTGKNRSGRAAEQATTAGAAAATAEGTSSKRISNKQQQHGQHKATCRSGIDNAAFAFNFQV